METYTLSQWGHFRAFLSVTLRCVCRCRARLDDVEYLLPHSRHTWLSPVSKFKPHASEPVGLMLATLSVPDDVPDDPVTEVGGDRSAFNPCHKKSIE